MPTASLAFCAAKAPFEKESIASAGVASEMPIGFDFMDCLALNLVAYF